MDRLVIMILVDVANGKQRHVPYRDSKLTYLLQVIIIYCLHKSARGNILFEVLRTMFMWFLAAFCKLGMLG
jgi:hypothetical protein